MAPYFLSHKKDLRNSEVNSFKLWKNQLLLSQLTLKNVLDLVAGSHQIVSLTVVKGGKDGTDAVGDDIHIVRVFSIQPRSTSLASLRRTVSRGMPVTSEIERALQGRYCLSPLNDAG